MLWLRAGSTVILNTRNAIRSIESVGIFHQSKPNVRSALGVVSRSKFTVASAVPLSGSERVNESKPKRFSGLALVVGTFASSAAWSAQILRQRGHVLAEFSTSTNADLEKETASKSEGAVFGANVDIVLYQYEVCPFCNKVRAYLDYNNIPYKVVEVDPLRKTEMKQFSSDYRKVPIAIVDGEQVNGSAAIIDYVHTKVNGEQTKIPDSEKKWVEWVDDHFVHLISPNIYRTPSESLQTFEYISNNAKFSSWQRATIRYSGAALMYMVAKKLKKKYNIDDERAAILAALREWTEAISENGGKFFGGSDRPGIADLSVYGVLRAIETFDTFADVRQDNAELGEWYDRTQKAVGETSITERS